MVGRYFIVYRYTHALHSVVPCGNGVGRTSVVTSKVDLLSGEVQRWSDGLGGHDTGSRSTQIQLLTELVRRQS